MHERGDSPDDSVRNDRCGVPDPKLIAFCGVARSARRVSIVIPVFNKVEYTQSCLEAIRRNTPAGMYECILVDNASTDGTGEFLSSLDGDLSIIHNDANLGFTKACNQGAKRATTEYVVFLNNDTEPQQGWLEALLELADSDQNIGVAGSKLVYPDGRLQEAGGIVFSDGSAWNYGRFDNPDDPAYNYAREVDYVSGASLLIRASLLERLGYFDERYSPGYYEDTDLCFGARSAGFRVMYCPFSVVVHHEGVSSGKSLTEGMKRFQGINRETFTRKWSRDLMMQFAPDAGNAVAACERGLTGNILVIDPFMPMFDRASGSLRLFTIIRLLRERGFHVTYVARNGIGQERYVRTLQRMGVEVYATDPDKLAELGYVAEAQRVDLKRILSRRSYQVAWLSFFEIGEQYLHEIRCLSPGTKIVIDTVDIHFVRERRMAEICRESGRKEQSRKTEERELSVYRKADAIVTVTEEDWGHVAGRLGDKPHFVIPNIHDAGNADLETEGREGLLFVGNFNHPPNADAVTHLAADIFPLVKKLLPEATLTIVGNNPPERVRQLASSDVIVTGYVPSIEPYMRRARVSVAPLRYGAGMKGKIGEALAHGLPVVTTSVGAEGMRLVDGETAFICEMPREFAERAVRLLKDDSLWLQMATRGREFITEHYSFGKVGTLLDAMMEKLGNLQTLPPSYSSLLTSVTKDLEIGSDRRVHCQGNGVTKGLTSIIVLTCNQLQYTRKCLQSIRRHTPETHEIIFVDNGSADGTVKWLRKLVKAHSNWRLIENSANLGFSKGCNQGIEASCGEYILLLNNDVLVTEDWLSGMLECLLSIPDAGIVGPMTNNITGVQRVQDVGYSSTEHLDEYARSFRERNRHRRIPHGRIVGFCMLFRRDLVGTIGILDERFGSGNFEDDDFCLRALLAGFRNLIAGDVFIHHFGSRTFIGNGIDYGSTISRNAKLFDQKWSRADMPLQANGLISIRALEKAADLCHEDRLKSAVDILLKSLAHSPGDRRAYHALVQMLIDAKEFSAALDLLQEMPGASEDEHALVLRGYCHEGMDQNGEADACADRCLGTPGVQALAMNLKGLIAHKNGDDVCAAEWFAKAIQSDPGYGEAHTNLGVLRWSAGSRDEAVVLLEKGFVLSPTTPDIASMYHSMVTATARYAQAENTLREARDLFPRSRRLAFLLIDAFLRQKKHAQAMALIEEVMAKFGVDDGILAAALEVRREVGPRRTRQGGKGRATLSLCMIVRDEESHLARCLASVASAVDEIIVVDTGSADRTRQIAEVYGAVIHHMQWDDDFAEARNLSLSKACGDWILVLDADEVISPRDLPRLRKLMHETQLRAAAYAFVTRNYVSEACTIGWTENDGTYASEEAGVGWFPSSKVRLFPHIDGIRFVGFVHEMVEPTLDGLGIKVHPSGIPIHHYGKLDDQRTAKKGRTYYLLGKKKLNEQGDDVKALSELAVQAANIGMYDEAISLWRQVLDRKNELSVSARVEANLNLAHACLERGQFDAAALAAQHAYEEAPQTKEAVLNHAMSQFYIGNGAETISCIEMLVTRCPDYPPAAALLAAAHLVVGRYEEGLNRLRKLGGLGHDCGECLRGHAERLLRAGRPDDAATLISAAADMGTGNGAPDRPLREYKRQKGVRDQEAALSPWNP